MADIGSTLREARIRAQIDVTEVETRTKIRAKYLRAIENEEWERLPGPVYTKSFLRTYGDYLGLDSRMLVEEFKRRYEVPYDHEPHPIASLSREREHERPPRGPLIPPWAAIGLVLVAIVVALYLLGNTGSSNKTPPPKGLHAGAHQHARPTPRHLTTSTTPTNVKLQLTPTADVYVCLVNGSGRMLIPGQIFHPGETIPTVTQRKLLLTLGNNSVQMKVNGSSVAIAPSSSAIGYLLSASGASTLPPSKQPTCK
jgi:cytoskeleton protein RodZ